MSGTNDQPNSEPPKPARSQLISSQHHLHVATESLVADLEHFARTMKHLERLVEDVRQICDRQDERLRQKNLESLKSSAASELRITGWLDKAQRDQDERSQQLQSVDAELVRSIDGLREGTQLITENLQQAITEHRSELMNHREMLRELSLRIGQVETSLNQKKRGFLQRFSLFKRLR